MFQVLTKPTVILAFFVSGYYFICTDLKKSVYFPLYLYWKSATFNAVFNLSVWPGVL